MLFLSCFIIRNTRRNFFSCVCFLVLPYSYAVLHFFVPVYLESSLFVDGMFFYLALTEVALDYSFVCILKDLSACCFSMKSIRLLFQGWLKWISKNSVSLSII